MLKKYCAALSATTLISLAPYALAASSTDLTVTGSITPGACTPTLSNGGVVDHGKTSAKDLNPDRNTNLPRETLQLSINCDAEQPIKLRVIDNRPGTSSDSTRFGLGFINGNQKLGGFYIRMANPLADGVAASTLASYDGGATWVPNKWMDPEFSLLSVGSISDTTTPIAVKDVTMDLEVSTAIARADSLDLTDEVAIDGSITLEVGYL
ncbi:DUF1120 domain-containing protein [Pseudomonas sp. PB120]|uniref:DUF1120 domain-containing protein n=1 Tax=Pseudomonas sp. PB120 TaxID=2494700 RepID=UPI0012FE5D15|nr:DUF1120 domain-containing protein [Pseudomonas sp. PB120]MVV52007.1 DUF1120 domain-containing protein [Pseudomonas sp. PB120]